MDELASDSPEAAFERATLLVGIEEWLRSVDWDRRELLIGLVSDEAELSTFVWDCVYITPRFDKDRLLLRYVSLYEKGIGISRYGEVVSWLQTEKGHEFDVLDWKVMAAPISVLEYGPSPIAYTNFFLLANSETFPELFLKNEDEYRFYEGLKRMTEETVLEDTDEATAFKFEGIKVLLDKKSSMWWRTESS